MRNNEKKQGLLSLVKYKPRIMKGMWGFSGHKARVWGKLLTHLCRKDLL